MKVVVVLAAVVIVVNVVSVVKVVVVLAVVEATVVAVSNTEEKEALANSVIDPEVRALDVVAELRKKSLILWNRKKEKTTRFW